MNPDDEPQDLSSIFAFDSIEDFDNFFYALCERCGVDPNDEFFKGKKEGDSDKESK